MKKKLIALLAAMLVFAFALTGCSSDDDDTTEVAGVEGVIYVDANAKADGDGSNWSEAYTDLQAALASAEAGDQIWVAKGTYYPSATDDENEYFLMLDDVDVYGGFNGDETELSARDWETNTTVLSGDIGIAGDNSDNTDNIIIAANNIMNGFTITGGNGFSSMSMEGMPLDGEMPTDDETSTGADSSGHSTPGEVLSGDATTTNNGGAIVIWGTAPTIKNCIISNNQTLKAGAVYIIETKELESLPKFINCTIKNNYAESRGGGVSLDMGGDAIFIDTTFSGNECGSKGGAVYNDFGCSPFFYNCLFENNIAESAAAMGNDGVSNPVVVNCTFVGNIAEITGAAMYQGTGPFNDPVVLNTIIWDNECPEDYASIYNWNDSNLTASYSIIESGYKGDGVLDQDPLFTYADNSNYGLSSKSVAFTAGKDGNAIGYDAEFAGTRTDDEIKAVIEYLSTVEGGEEITPLDVTNYLADSDISYLNHAIYVSVDGSGNGYSWSSALSDVQTALDLANAKYEQTGEKVEVWVSSGTYYAGESRSDSIQLREGVSLYGGFAGDETSTDQRNIDVNTTILSGDIGVPDVAADNNYHVVIGADNALIDGFTITNGYADAADGQIYDNKGGGILNYLAGYRVIPTYEPTLGFDTIINNCSFKENYAVEGGAIYTYHGGNPVVANCSFINNSAVYGGAIVDRGGVNSKYTDCYFQGNTVVFKGGAALVDYGSMATFDNCKFNDNESGTSGGAIYVIDRASQSILNDTDFDQIDDTWELLNDIYSSVLVTDCEFIGNTAGTTSGAIYVYEGGYAKIVTSDFSDNSAISEAGAVGIYSNSHLIIDDATTFSNNSPEDIFAE
ncbi:right-handed parallel beta-helix repeat-containing protein [Desulforapulum autotrophicum]|nr:right-handed parallel beta-helix repeat-containing protein [Desulforapulum autotrophicum]